MFKKILCLILFLFPCTLHAQSQGDIVGVVVESDGFTATIEIYNWTLAATFDFDYATNNVPDTGTPSLTVTSQGYDAAGSLGTIVRTVYFTRVKRKAYPDDADLDLAVPASNLFVKISLSASVYDDDDAAGSGTDIACNIPAGWGEDLAVVTTDSAEFTGNATNSSTVDYPMAFGRWDHLAGAMHADRVTDDFVIAVMPVAGFGVACVKLDALGQTSSHNPGTATLTMADAATAAFSESGLFRFFIPTTIPIAGFNASELVDLRFRVFPSVGDADSVYDTDSFTDSLVAHLGRNKATITVDDGGSTIGDTFAVVDTAGNDGTGVSSTTLGTADASPFLTWGAAKDATPAPNIIYFNAGTHELIGSASTQRNVTEWIRALPHPDTSKANVTLTIDDITDYRCSWTSYEDINLQGSPSVSGFGIDGENNNSIRFRGVTFTNAGFVSQLPIQYRSATFYAQNCDGDLCPAEWKVTDSGGIGAYALDGCDFTATSNAAFVLVSNMVGCDVDGGWSVQNRASVTSTPSPDGFIFAYNKFMDFPLGASPGHGSLYGSVYTITMGSALINNVLETRIRPADALQWGSGLNAGETWNNAILMHNSIIGEAWNGPYNNTGSTPGTVTSHFSKANIMDVHNFKTDTFTGDSGGNGLRIGNWSAVYGVNYKFDVHREVTVGELKFEFSGLNTLAPAATFTFIDNATAVVAGGSGLGNGDYHLVAGASAIGIMDEVLIPFDIDGTARFIDSDTNGGAAGAYEFGTEPSVVTGEAGRRDTRARRRYSGG